MRRLPEVHLPAEALLPASLVAPGGLGGAVGPGPAHAATTIHAAPAAFRGEAPYRVAIVDLEEGLRLATRLWGDDPAPLDGAVRIVALRHEDGALFAARPEGVTGAATAP